MFPYKNYRFERFFLLCIFSAALGIFTQAHAEEIRLDAKTDSISVLNRITWGINDSTVNAVKKIGINQYLGQQLHLDAKIAPVLPQEVEAQIARMTISQKTITVLLQELEKRRKEINSIASDDEKKAAQRDYQQDLNRLAREASSRALLRVLYSPNAIQEQMTWFWINHFSVFQGKNNLRALVGDFEEQAIRPFALGKFCELLAATAHHPAMLVYLDNAQNGVNRINENYARELMELHTLGVNSGYTQKDVQELARILTGLSVNFSSDETPRIPKIRPELQAQYIRQGLFEFNPNRHDYGDKLFLGQTIRGAGLSELDIALKLLSQSPKTANFISQKLAAYWVSDVPPPDLVERMAKTYLQTDGDIASVLITLFNSNEFAKSLGKQFKDPLHYIVSSVRLAYNSKPILNPNPMLNWLSRMGEARYGHQTPDGYALNETAWASPGQMSTRFEIAKAIGSGNAGLFRSEDSSPPQERPAFPQLATPLYYQAMQPKLSPQTRQALEQANSPQEWNTFYLSSPEMMRH